MMFQHERKPRRQGRRLPLDPTESADLDKDGVGDNKDPDKDGDDLADVFDETPITQTKTAAVYGTAKTPSQRQNRKPR